MGGAKNQMMKEYDQGYHSIYHKYICVDCVGDKSLKKLIKLKAVSRDCSYCGAHSNIKIAAEFDLVMHSINKGIRLEWDDPANAGMAYEGGFCGDTYDTYELVHHEIEELQDTNETFLDDVINSLTTGEWCRIPVYGPSKKEKMLSSWSAFSYYVKHFSRYQFLLNPQELDESFDGRTIPFGQILEVMKTSFDDHRLFRRFLVGDKIYRVRITDIGKKVLNYKDISAPPIEKARRPNRMSPAGISFFYGALEKKTAIMEALDSERNISKKTLHIGTFKVQRSFSVYDLTHELRIPGLFDPNASQRDIILFLRDFRKQISIPILQDGKEHIEYVPTQILTEYLMAQAETDGILYRSSRNPEGRNIALKAFSYERSLLGDNHKNILPLTLLRINSMPLKKWKKKR
jgi:hypothetical protein